MHRRDAGARHHGDGERPKGYCHFFTLPFSCLNLTWSPALSPAANLLALPCARMKAWAVIKGVGRGPTLSGETSPLEKQPF